MGDHEKILVRQHRVILAKTGIWGGPKSCWVCECRPRCRINPGMMVLFRKVFFGQYRYTRTNGMMR
ncbi:MAG: hypothetical protein EBZ69_10515 [Alphaproteobacteria bacterium]|nr:hypothetical protein [Alphaproteobacteria bacterium]